MCHTQELTYFFSKGFLKTYGANVFCCICVPDFVINSLVSKYLQGSHLNTNMGKTVIFSLIVFTESAHWADLVRPSVCTYVCMYVPCEEDLSFHWRGLLHIPPNIGVGCVCVCGGGGVGVMCHVSCVMCHVSRVTCHMSRVTCDV